MNIEELISNNVEQPRFDNVIVTLDQDLEFGEDESLSEIQKVVAVGPHVKDIEPGNSVRIDLERLYEPYIENGERMYRVKISPIVIGDETCAIISDRIIKTVLK